MKRNNFGWLALLLASPAAAHVGLSHVTGFMAGVTHPLSGVDHVTVMVAVGLWSYQQGGKATYQIPIAFMAAMLIGSSFAMPLTEQGIAASVLLACLLVAGAVRLPIQFGAAIVGLFGLYHGSAHGIEGNGLGYASGFMLSTALLNAAGVALGWRMQHSTGVQSRVYLAGSAATGINLVK